MQNDRLFIARTLGYGVHLGIYVAVGDKNIRPAVVIEVHKASSPGNVGDARLSDLRRPARVFKTLVTKIAIEGFGLIGKCRVDDIERSIVIVIAEVDSHVALLEAFAAQSHSSEQRYIGKRAVMIVVVKIVRAGIVGDE